MAPKSCDSGYHSGQETEGRIPGPRQNVGVSMAVKRLARGSYRDMAQEDSAIVVVGGHVRRVLDGRDKT